MAEFGGLAGNLETPTSNAEAEFTATAPSTPQQPFEWIPFGDSTARKRARAHVTRGFRREKAAQAKAQLSKSGNDFGSGRPSRTRESSSSSSSDSAISTPSNALARSQPRSELDVEDVSAKSLAQGMMLHRALGSDPCASYPIQLGVGEKQLLDHFFTGLAPLTFSGDSHSDFQPVKKLIFNMSLLGAPGFHVILAAAANDIAAQRGEEESEDAMIHQRTAIGLVNRRLAEWPSEKTSDGLASVALLAGQELLFGTPKNYKTHMDGLAIMLELRGGLESFRKTSPQVYAIISWFDYAGSCNLVSRRRFVPIRHPSPLYTVPDGVLAKILSGLPAGYDLYKELMDIIEGMIAMTFSVRDPATQPHNFPESLSQVDNLLHQSMSLPETRGNRSRRRHLLQSLYLLFLIYTILVSNFEGSSCEVFMYRFENVWAPEMGEWSRVVNGLFRSLLAGEGFESEVFVLRVEQAVNLLVMFQWKEWRRINEVLLQFFVGDSACSGQLQEVWKGRMGKGVQLVEL